MIEKISFIKTLSVTILTKNKLFLRDIKPSPIENSKLFQKSITADQNLT